MLNILDHKRYIIKKVNKIAEFANRYIITDCSSIGIIAILLVNWFISFNYWDEHIINNFLLIIINPTKTCEKHLFEILFAHEASLIFDLLVHCHAHVVEDSVVHFELNHFANDREF